MIFNLKFLLKSVLKWIFNNLWAIFLNSSLYIAILLAFIRGWYVLQNLVIQHPAAILIMFGALFCFAIFQFTVACVLGLKLKKFKSHKKAFCALWDSENNVVCPVDYSLMYPSESYPYSMSCTYCKKATPLVDTNGKYISYAEARKNMLDKTPKQQTA